MKTFITHSPQETEELAGKLAALLSPGDIIAYEGGMGMGKTAFTRGLCRGLGIAADVSSPTFSLVNEYRGENATLYHFDMFRVESFSDLYSTGFFDYLDYGGILLSLDTSSLAASAALWEDERLLGEFFINAKLTHSQTAMPMVEDLLKATQTSLSQVDLFAVSTGPGSFTGLRIGIAAVKGMAHALGKPCIPVSTLKGMAYNLLGFDGYVCPVMDARCQQVYTALFEMVGGRPVQVEEDSAIPLTQLENRLSRLSKRVFLVGDGAKLCYNECIGSCPNIVLAPPSLLFQKASSVAQAALEDLEAAVPAAELAPAYLRLPQAERELLRKQNQKG